MLRPITEKQWPTVQRALRETFNHHREHAANLRKVKADPTNPMHNFMTAEAMEGLAREHDAFANEVMVVSGELEDVS